MTSVAAVAIVAAFTSCHKELEMVSPNDFAQAQYKASFTNYVGGTIASNQDWGFGSSANQAITRGATRRAALPATPSFRDTNPIVKPTVPSAYQNSVPAGAKYAKDYENYQSGDVIYINTEYQRLNQPQNFENLTIYVDGNVTFCGATNQGGNGTAFCVTENSTLTLGAVSNNLIVYLAPGATLDIRKGKSENVTSWWPYESEIVDNGNNSFSFQNEHAAIYMSAGSTVKATDLTLINGAKLLNDGGTIEATNLTLDQNATLWNEGTFKVTNTLTLTNKSSSLYNKEGKTIEAANLDLINNNALLFNEGSVTATGAITLHNTNAEIINYGTLSGASFSSGAGGKMHNEGTGTVTITGKTDLTNSNSTWMNDGQWTCGSFDVDNYSDTNINNCRLTVNGNFHLNRGTFVLSANSGVVCESFTWEDTSDFYLGSNSVLKINGNLLTKNANSGYGFRGIGTEYAVVQAARIYHEGNEQFRMSYYGKLLVATQNHFDQWYKDAPNTNQPAYWYESSVKFTKDGDNIATITATDCNPGYEGSDGGDDDNGGGSGDDNEVFDIRIIGEDLSATSRSDFDFNDIVIDVKYDANNAVVMLQAAGGTLKLRFGNGSDKVWEVHELFGVAHKVMVNTHAENIPGAAYATKAPVRQELGYGINNAAEAKTKLKIEVYKNNEWCELTAETAEPAAKIAVDTDYQWLDERTSIKDVYSGFVSWVQNPDRNNKWWKPSNE